ncbi:hypothetical protein GCM10023168_29490 [Fodinibacter luteus]|uniref:Methyltransferase domain-containing protein n=2 Tax=Fodinibacter luteus TaxID=552064 RepID=A0ABP8KM62_9MICO
MPERPRADPRDQVDVVAALGRLGTLGGWDRVRAGEALEGLDRVDADLLLAAGILGRDGAGRYTVIDDDLVDVDGASVSHAIVAQLRRALEHTERRSAGWDGAHPATVLSQGRASRPVADYLARELLPRMPGSQAALQSGMSRFLDVGVGVAAIAARLCQIYPGLGCVGIDVLPEVLGLAANELTALGLADRVELRVQSVSELEDEEVFDLAWLPQPFIPRAALEAGVPLVHRALRPNRWVVVPLAVGSASDPFEMAVFAHTAQMLGGGPIRVADAEDLLATAGFDQIISTSWRGQMLVLARRP